MSQLRGKPIFFKQGDKYYELTTVLRSKSGNVLDLDILANGILNMMRRSEPKDSEDINYVNGTTYSLLLASFPSILSYFTTNHIDIDDDANINYSEKTPPLGTSLLRKYIVDSMMFGYLLAITITTSSSKLVQDQVEIDKDKYDLNLQATEVTNLAGTLSSAGLPAEASMAAALFQYNAGSELLDLLRVPVEASSKILELKKEIERAAERKRKRDEEERMKNAN